MKLCLCVCLLVGQVMYTEQNQTIHCCIYVYVQISDWCPVLSGWMVNTEETLPVSLCVIEANSRCLCSSKFAQDLLRLCICQTSSLSPFVLANHCSKIRHYPPEFTISQEEDFIECIFSHQGSESKICWDFISHTQWTSYAGVLLARVTFKFQGKERAYQGLIWQKEVRSIILHTIILSLYCKVFTTTAVQRQRLVGVSRVELLGEEGHSNHTGRASPFRILTAFNILTPTLVFKSEKMQSFSS